MSSPASLSNVLIDSNLLLLLVVGKVNRTRIGRYKRTQKYTTEDFDLLTRTLRQFQQIVTTPHVLAEVSNLSGGLYGSELERVRQELRIWVSEIYEIHLPAREAVAESEFLRLGDNTLSGEKSFDSDG